MDGDPQSYERWHFLFIENKAYIIDRSVLGMMTPTACHLFADHHIRPKMRNPLVAAGIVILGAFLSVHGQTTTAVRPNKYIPYIFRIN